MITSLQISEFVQKIGEIYRPDNPGKRYEVRHLLHDIPTCSKLLIKLISSDENDVTLERLDKDFHIHLASIVEMSSLDNLPIAIEGLAQKFEAFLKKIAFLKYGDTELWKGNITSAGINGTSLNNLCEGIIANRFNVTESIPNLILPEPLVKYSGVTRSLLDFTRQKLRNAVHYAPEINRKDLIPYSEIVVLVYFLTVQDNFDFLSQKFLPQYAYKGKLIKHFKKWFSLYVDIDSKFKSNKDFLEISPELSESDWLDENDLQIKKRNGTITEIFSVTNRMIIVGGPGQGKTTALQFLGYQIASNSDLLPIYFPLKEFDSQRSLNDQIADNIGISSAEFIELYESGRVIFLLDGLNEVILDASRIVLNNQLIHFINKNPYIPITISTRPGDYRNELKLPIFELLPFTNEKIRDYLQKYYNEEGIKLYNVLEKAPRLVNLCRNPLLLKILGSIFINGDVEIPENKGLLLKKFIHSLLIRERTKNYLISPEKLKYFLVNIGYSTRINEKVSFDHGDVINIINKTATEIDPTVDRIKIIEYLLDLNILSKNNDKLSFSHELYQEYFAAEGLYRYNSINEILELSNKPQWEQPIIMYSGFIDYRAKFILELTEIHPLLAVGCALTSIKEEAELQESLVKINYEKALDIESNHLASEALISLIQLGYSEIATNAIKYNFNLSGKRAFASYQNICHEIISKVDINHLAKTIEILLSIDSNFTKMILRGIDTRQENEIIIARKELESTVELFDIRKLSNRYISILLKLVSDDNLELIKNIGYKLLRLNMELTYPILKNFTVKNSNCLPDLISNAFKSSNIKVHIDAVFHCIKLNISSKFRTELEESNIFNNAEYRSRLEKMTDDWKNYESVLIWIYNDIESKKRQIEKKKTLLEFQSKLNSWVRCNVLDKSKKSYISIRIQGYPGSARIYKDEILTEQSFVFNRSLSLRISYILHKNGLILLSQKEVGNINYIEEKKDLKKEDLLVGKLEECKVVKIVPNYLLIVTKNGMKGSIHISQISENFVRDLESNFTVGQWINAIILEKNERFGLILTLKKLTSTETSANIPINRLTIRVNKFESDISIKLKNALMKNGNNY